jgi:hypothetical protein
VLPELVGEPFDAAFGLLNRVAVLLQGDVLRHGLPPLYVALRGTLIGIA